MSSASEPQARWERHARQLAARINAGWWLDRFAPGFLALSAAGTCALMILRRHGAAGVAFWWTAAGLTALLATAAWLLARRRFEPADAARVRLEAALGLHNRLTAAAAGIGAWPEAPAHPGRVLDWKWQRPAAAVALGLALLAAAALIPIPEAHPPRPAVLEKPAALAQVEQWVNQLREEPLIQPEALERLDKQAQELMNRPPEQWYEHNSLEAADHMKQQTEQALRQLQRDLEAMQRSAEQLTQFKGAVPASMLNAWSNQVSGALEGLKLGELPLDPSLMQALSGLDPSKIPTLTPEQAAALAKRLAAAGGKLASLKLGKPGSGQCNNPTSATNGAAVFAAQPGSGNGPPGAGQDGPGAGGVGRGPGAAPLSFTQDPTQLGTSAQEKLSNPDMEHASPSDLVGLTQGEHEVDRKAWQGSAAGGAASAGQGGETVWQESLAPEERDVLKNYYR